MATIDTGTWDKRLNEVNETANQYFTNPNAKDIAQHCMGLLRDATNIERNITGQPTGAGKEANYNTSR